MKNKMKMIFAAAALACACATFVALPVVAQEGTIAPAENLVVDGVPAIPASLAESGVLGEMARPLSPRELEILRMIVQGKSHREIADELKIQVNTVRAHRANMMQAMGVHKAVQLALYAVARGLVKA